MFTTTFLATVLGDVVAYFIIKWLDRQEQFQPLARRPDLTQKVPVSPAGLSSL